MDKEFDKAIGEERDRFVIAVRDQEWNTELRTAAENILVMYDQMRDRLSLRKQPLRGDTIEDVSVPDLTDLSDERKNEVVKGLTKIAASEFLKTFVALGLTSYIEAEIANETTGDLFKLSFKKCDKVMTV